MDQQNQPKDIMFSSGKCQRAFFFFYYFVIYLHELKHELKDTQQSQTFANSGCSSLSFMTVNEASSGAGLSAGLKEAL